MVAPAVSVPLSQYVLKVHSRCDLACDHCYVYEHADQGWRRQPRAMSLATVRAAAGRIADHATAHRLPRVRVVVHGGEPLLLGPDGLDRILSELAGAITPATHLDLRMQTNGVLLSEAVCDVLARYDVRVGVSLDGGRAANDRHRRFADGRSSYDRVLRGLELLRRPEYRRLYAGLLCTVDIANDPIAVYEALVAQRPPRVDFLLPHATWDAPPPRTGPAPYAQWLGRIYERWIADGRPMGVRLFDSLIATGSGRPSGSEAVGLAPADLVVIETDGAWEQADSLKTSYDGAPATGLDVFTDPVDAVAVLPGIAARQAGLAGLSDTCRACSVVRQCGGGLYAHRYRTGAGFDNPSVYCTDLKELIGFMNNRPAPAASVRALPAGVLDQLATGYGDRDAVRHLAEAQLSITRALVVAAAEQRSGDLPAEEGWRALSALDHDPAARWAVSSVLAHPYVRPWAVGCLNPKRPGPIGRSFLGSLAAAAAIRAGAAVDVTVPVHSGAVFLPTVGSVAVPPAGLTATISVSAGGFQLRCGPQIVTVPDRVYARRPGWRPAQWFREDGLEVVLEDADPNRDQHDWRTAGHLDPIEVRRWWVALSAAWRIVQSDAPDYAPGVRAGLRAVTPLMPDPLGLLRSSTARDAFGAAGVALTDPEALAVMIVHEFQHSKLGAVFDLCDMFDRTFTGRLTVGWRPDSRPIEGAFQGAYAHLAVADVWRRRAERGVPEAAQAFQTYRQWTSEAIDALLDSGALTPSGVDFLRRTAETVASWR